ncbi:MAG: Gfo/Idh/MocA family oxidoreductase [Methylacidiphilales bacterium]|nr:Gfo/Idh/MocA family oxidoreductase [Candidatus Methylacidiphilales bacterium]
MLNVALVGVSGFADFHYRELLALRQKGLVRLLCATVINQDEEAAKCQTLREIGCELFSDHQRMLREGRGRIDLCVIPTGIHLHAPMTVDALHADCHVLVEKPAAATVEEVTWMQEEERRSGKSVAVAYQHLYAPEIMKMKRDLLGGKIGRLLAVKCLGLWPRPESYYKRNNWAGRLKHGESWVLDSPFNNAFAHWLNLICFLAGSTAEASAHPRTVQAELYRARAIESADTACFRIETTGDIPLFFHVTHSCLQNLEPELEVRGSDGSLCWTRAGIFHRSQNGSERLYAVSSENASRRHMYEAVLRHISGEKTSVCGLEIAKQQTLCSNAAFFSSPINDIPSEFLVKGEAPAPKVVAIRDIEKIFRTAFEQEIVWSQMPVPWARAGRIIPTEDFRKSMKDDGMPAPIVVAPIGNISV